VALLLFVSLAHSSQPVRPSESLDVWSVKHGSRFLEYVLPLGQEDNFREGVNWRFSVRIVSWQRPPELWVVEENEYGMVRVERRWIPDGFLSRDADEMRKRGHDDDFELLARLTTVTVESWSSGKCSTLTEHSKRLEATTIPLTPVVSFVQGGTTYAFDFRWVDGYRVSGRAYAGDLDAPRDKIPQWVEKLRRICLNECNSAQ
jgi:hypothetical protein